MAITGPRRSRALAEARSIRSSIGREVREARLNAGLSQLVAARAVGMSHAQLGRIERGELRGLTVEQSALACAAVGLRLAARPYPAGDAPVDEAHLALLGRLRGILPPGVTMRTEAPIGPPGDLRAWDAVIELEDGPLAVEAETRLRDLQALERRVALKQRDSGIARVLLLVSASVANREVVHAHADDLALRFDLSARHTFACLRSGQRPGRSAVLLL